MQNKESGTYRPTFYCLKDEKTSLLWMVPLSSWVDKFRAIHDKRKKYSIHNQINTNMKRLRQLHARGRKVVFPDITRLEKIMLEERCSVEVDDFGYIRYITGVYSDAEYCFGFNQGYKGVKVWRCTVRVVTSKTGGIRRLASSCFPLSGDIDTIPEITREEAAENVRQAGYEVEEDFCLKKGDGELQIYSENIISGFRMSKKGDRA